jgi:hypothetical protein
LRASIRALFNLRANFIWCVEQEQAPASRENLYVTSFLNSDLNGKLNWNSLIRNYKFIQYARSKKNSHCYNKNREWNEKRKDKFHTSWLENDVSNTTLDVPAS